MQIIRVFPRKTNATPTDDLSYWGPPPMFPLDADEIHVSVAFTYDIPHAEYLAEQWKHVAPVKIGGPATGMKGEGFVPGRYLKPGYVITSRGCNNRCSHCKVPGREGRIRELPITEGHNVLDDNLLQCSDKHIREVFSMLKRQKWYDDVKKKYYKQKTKFTGGLEAAALQEWHVELLRDLKPESLFFAYDDEADYEPLAEASLLLKKYDFTRYHMRCYVLCGQEGDSLKEAEKRMFQTVKLGFYPMAMLYMNDEGKGPDGWKRFQQQWIRPADIYGLLNNPQLTDE